MKSVTYELEDLHKWWDADGKFDESQPDKVNRDIPYLHGKWWRFATTVKQSIMTCRMLRDALAHDRREWYMGRMSVEDTKKRGWELQHLRLVRQDVDAAMATDPLVRPLSLTLEFEELKLQFINDVIKMINYRSSLVKNHIEWLRFSSGSN